MISRIRIFIGICSVYMHCFLRNYKALAEIYEEGCIGVDYHSCDLHFYRRDIAGKFLKKGGSKAVDSIVDQIILKQKKNETYGVFSANADLAEVLINIGDLKAVAILEELLAKGCFKSTSQGSTIERFIEKNSLNYRQKQAKSKEIASSELTAAIEKVGKYSEQEMIKILEQLCAAYSLNSQSEITKLEPIATAVGIELNRRGGLPKMREIYSNIVNLKGSRTLEMHWNGVGDWRG